MYRAASLIRDMEVHAPVLIDYEMASIARSKIRREPASHEVIIGFLRAMLATDIQRHYVDQVGVVQLALETGLSSYDASYLYLARHLDLPLVTFDRQLRAAAEGT